MSRRKKKRGHENVELNLAAMLDMAFQLLTFFIITFKTAPPESQVIMNLPPPAPIEGKAGGPSKVGEDTGKPPKPEVSLIVSIFADPTKPGKVGQYAIGDQNVERLDQLASRLRNDVANPKTNFEQLIVQVSSDVPYDEVMKVVDICSKLKRANGEPISALSFVENPGAK